MDRRELVTLSAATVLSGLIPWTSNAQQLDQPNLLGYLRTNWSRDPFSYGTYSHLARGSSRKHHRQLCKPIAEKVYLAGEASNPDRNSSVHAALESGRLVAATIMESSSQRIGIIGAGIAGLSAAQLLHNAGRDVEVIEARDRIGGALIPINHLDSLQISGRVGFTDLMAIHLPRLLPR